jgi:transcriptional regulator with XRE-family HTH domain
MNSLSRSQPISPIRLGLAEKLKSQAYRLRLFRSQAQDEIAMQIRALRLKRGFQRQVDFARRCGLQQSAVSRIEQADYQGWTFKTLLKVAEALDARLRITFEPAERVIAEYGRREEESFGDWSEVSSESSQVRPISGGETTWTAASSKTIRRELLSQLTVPSAELVAASTAAKYSDFGLHVSHFNPSSTDAETTEFRVS